MLEAVFTESWLSCALAHFYTSIKDLNSIVIVFFD